MKSQTKDQSLYQSYRYGLRQAKRYFLESNEWYIALPLLIGSIISVIALVGIIFVFSWWVVGFWAAIMAMDFALFSASMEIFALITTCYVAVTALNNYLIKSLAIRWRDWLTSDLIQKYIDGDINYLDLMRNHEKIDNPQQRIQEDVKLFVKSYLSLNLDFLYAALSCSTFIGSLWVVGGSLSFVALGATVTIPGYLVWVALILALTASLIIHKIGHSIEGLTRTEKRLEADFRKDLDLINSEAESIALERGEGYYNRSLRSKLNEIVKNAYLKLQVKTRLMSFQSFYEQFSSTVPYIAAAPLYFMGYVSIGQLMQIGFSFVQVNASFSWFVNSYTHISFYRASAVRIIELEAMLEDDGIELTKNEIKVRENESKDTVVIKSLNIAYPDSTKYIMRGLNLTFNRGEHTLIKGESGLGKSTFFKAMAGSWKYGEGDIMMPTHQKVCFLPHKPSLPNDTLKAVLAYPESFQTYTDDQYIKALQSVGKMDSFIEELDTVSSWSKRFSQGQQQRISFARVLLKKPDWLFLDESTSSLDVPSEEHVYTLLQTQLPDTTFISIAHRPSVYLFHKRMVTFDSINDAYEIQLTDSSISDEKKLDSANNQTFSRNGMLDSYDDIDGKKTNEVNTVIHL